MFWLLIIIIAIISIILSILSLRNINARSEVRNVKKELSKNRVIYQDSSLPKD